MLYLDAERLNNDLGRYAGLTGRWYSPLRFRRGDHLGSGDQSLADGARDLVQKELGVRPSGGVFLLTGFGFMAHRFNPVSFYYCFDEAGKSLDFVIAEVTNTPWGQRHCYVLDCRESAGQTSELSHDKVFHVSPFMPMDTRYHWAIECPGEMLKLRIDVSREQSPLFSAGLNLSRKPLTRLNLWRCLCWMPFTSIKVVAAIHWQAFCLWLKKNPFYPHPDLSGEKS
jgi:DUF1365 family protein